MYVERQKTRTNYMTRIEQNSVISEITTLPALYPAPYPSQPQSLVPSPISNPIPHPSLCAPALYPAPAQYPVPYPTSVTVPQTKPQSLCPSPRLCAPAPYPALSHSICKSKGWSVRVSPWRCFFLCFQGGSPRPWGSSIGQSPPQGYDLYEVSSLSWSFLPPRVDLLRQTDTGTDEMCVRVKCVSLYFSLRQPAISLAISPCWGCVNWSGRGGDRAATVYTVILTYTDVADGWRIVCGWWMKNCQLLILQTPV